MKTKLYILCIGLFILVNSYGSDVSELYLRNDSIMRALFKSWNDHDVNKLVSLFSDNSIYEVINTGGSFSGKQEIASYATSTFSGVPDTRLIIRSMVTTDSIGMVEWIWKGTNTVGWPGQGIPATNKHFEVRGISVIKIENGLIIQNRDYWDWNTFIKGISD